MHPTTYQLLGATDGRSIDMITFVWAEDENGLIGSKGDLPWHLPADMQFFKKVTLTGDVVMGRKTLESIPNPPLKNRENYVLTSKKSLDFKGGVICHSKEDVLEKTRHSKKPLHVIGEYPYLNFLKMMWIDSIVQLYMKPLKGRPICLLSIIHSLN